MLNKNIISNIYKPPERYVVELDLFISEFSHFIDSLRGLNRLSFICCDFNINLLDIISKEHVKVIENCTNFYFGTEKLARSSKN